MPHVIVKLYQDDRRSRRRAWPSESSRTSCRGDVGVPHGVEPNGEELFNTHVRLLAGLLRRGASCPS